MKFLSFLVFSLFFLIASSSNICGPVGDGSDTVGCYLDTLCTNGPISTTESICQGAGIFYICDAGSDTSSCMSNGVPVSFSPVCTGTGANVHCYASNTECTESFSSVSEQSCVYSIDGAYTCNSESNAHCYYDGAALVASPQICGGGNVNCFSGQQDSCTGTGNTITSENDCILVEDGAYTCVSEDGLDTQSCYYQAIELTTTTVCTDDLDVDCYPDSNGIDCTTLSNMKSSITETDCILVHDGTYTCNNDLPNGCYYQANKIDVCTGTPTGVTCYDSFDCTGNIITELTSEETCTLSYECKSGTPSGCLNNGEVIQDPHVVGFDGKKYNFKGVNGEFYNIISEEYFQLNSEIVIHEVYYDGGPFPPERKQTPTYLGDVGIMIGTDQLYIPLREESIYLNGEKLVLKKGETVVLGNCSIFSDFFFKVHGYMIHLSRFPWKYEKEELKYGKFYRMDIQIKLDRNSRGMDNKNAHGILGQSEHARNLDSMNYLEGEEKDYIVTGPFGVDFKYNVFNGKTCDREISDRINENFGKDSKSKKSDKYYSVIDNNFY